MVTLDHGWEQSTASRAVGQHYAGVFLLLIVIAAAIVASLLIGGLLTLIFGSLPAGLWFAIYAFQIVPAVFFGGAIFVSGQEQLEVS